MKQILVILSISFSVFFAKGQSPDSRMCNCFRQPVPADFLTASRAIYGSMGIMLSAGIELKPAQSQPVKFILPEVPALTGCNAYYQLYVADSAGRKIYESTGQNREITYVFPGCGRNYQVQLIAGAKSPGGKDGNCSRRLRFSVTPRCNQQVCNCFTQKGGKTPVSGDLNITGGVDCIGVNGARRRYAIRFGVVNKTDCVLNVQSFTLHGQTVEVPPYSIPPRGSTEGVSLGFSTPAGQSQPADNRILAMVRYTLNGKQCAANIEMPYQTCK